MSADRNEPCPCGSGKKYKKCCGAVSIDDPVTFNRKNAYTGSLGLKREQFCLEYAIYKKDVMSRGEEIIREKIAAAGETITCKKGCGTCCILYVTATLQEAECIVHYLYGHEEILNHFLSAYQTWRKGLGIFYNKLPRLDGLVARHLADCLSPEESVRFSAETNGFAACRSSCPFLMDDACSIYPVRPFVCSSVIATTPVEKCRWDGTGRTEAKYYRYGFPIESDMPYFVKPRNPVVFGCMPELVHRILQEGYTFLSGIEGLESLHR